MTAAPGRCELCDAELGGRGHDLVGGMALCRRCFQGGVDGMVEARGWALQSSHHEVSREGAGSDLGSSDLVYVTRVRIGLPAASSVQLKAQRRWWWMALVGLFRGRARSRDPLFEKHVRVWTPVPAQVERFMAGPGVESSLLDTLGNLGTSYVQIRGSEVRVAFVADDPHTEGEVVARACVLARHVERFAGQP